MFELIDLSECVDEECSGHLIAHRCSGDSNRIGRLHASMEEYLLEGDELAACAAAAQIVSIATKVCHATSQEATRELGL